MRFRLNTLFWITLTVALILAIVANWDAIPGTYYVDANHNHHGTGVNEYHYENGAVMGRDNYYRGMVYQSTWYTPDGDEIASEPFVRFEGGVYYILRQDGTIRAKYTYKYNAKEDRYDSVNPVYYDRAGRPKSDTDE